MLSLNPGCVSTYGKQSKIRVGGHCQFEADNKSALVCFEYERYQNFVLFAIRAQTQLKLVSPQHNIQGLSLGSMYHPHSMFHGPSTTYAINPAVLLCHVYCRTSITWFLENT